MKFFTHGFNKEYLSKNNTTIVNGFFIIMVFVSHFGQYIIFDTDFEHFCYFFVGLFGQLMVTTFLFFSGYGIHENFKKKKEEYVNSFFKKRFIKTYLNRAIAILLFLIVNIILQNSYSIYHIIFSFIGWESIGNSNRYMFDIFILYLLFILSFKYNKGDKTKLSVNIFLTLLFVCVLMLLKEESLWYDTILCFPFGMLYSKYKEKIDSYVMNNNRRYTLILICTIVLFMCLYILYHLLVKAVPIHILFNIVSFIFVLIICLLLMKIDLKSKIFWWFGKNLFWIYILQRIPMMLFKDKISNDFIYFIICFISTIFLTIIMKRVLSLITMKSLSSR